MGTEKLGGSRAAWGFCSFHQFTECFHSSHHEKFPRQRTCTPQPCEAAGEAFLEVRRQRNNYKARTQRTPNYTALPRNAASWAKIPEQKQPRDNHQLDARSRAEAALLGSEGTKGRQEGPADGCTGQLVTTEAMDETKI